MQDSKPTNSIITKNVRNIALDAACGVLIIHMIMTHIYQHAGLTDSPEYAFTRLLSFFMPWFFFKAGMFYKRIPIKKVIKSSSKRLLLPYIVFLVIGEIVLVICKLVTAESITLNIIIKDIVDAFKSIVISGASAGNLALWFLLSLFCVKVLWSVLESKKLYILIIVVSAVPMLCHFFEITRPLWIANICNGFIYYVFGYYLRNVHVRKWSICLCLIAAWVVLQVWFPNVIDMRSNKLISGYYILSYPVNLIGIFAINSLFSLTPYRFKWLAQVGNQSMGYYCLHWIILVVVGFVFMDYSDSRYHQVLACILSCALLLPIAIVLIRRSKYSHLI